MIVSGSDVKFELWANLWHNTLGDINSFFNEYVDQFKKTKFLENLFKDNTMLEGNMGMKNENLRKNGLEMREVNKN